MNFKHLTERLMKTLFIFIALHFCLLTTQAHAFTFNETQSASTDGAGSTLVFPAFDLAAGSLVVGGVKWEKSAGTPTISTVTDTAGNTYVLLARKDNSGAPNGDPKVQQFYCLFSIANASNVITVTFSDANPTFKRGRIVEELTTGATFDVEASGEATSGMAPVTGAFSTVNAAEYVFAMLGGFTSETFSSPLIGGNAVTFRGASTAVDSTAFDYITASQISSGTAGATMSVSNRWTIVSAAFKEAVVGGRRRPPIIFQ